MAKSPEEGMASLLKNLETQTGKSITLWVATARAIGLQKHKELVTWLKSEHGLTHGYANQIAIRSLQIDLGNSWMSPLSVPIHYLPRSGRL